MSKNFQYYIKKFNLKKKYFLVDSESNNKITFSKFRQQILKDKFEVNKLNNNAVYILKVDNSIASILLISTFIYYKKKIILFPKNQSINEQLKKNIKFKSFIVNNNKELFLEKISSKPLTETNFDILIMSSGSTGISKLVKLDLKKSLHNSISMGKITNFNETNIHLMLMPIYHVNSFFYSFLSSIIYRQTLVLSKGFKLLNFWKIVKRHKIKTTSISPSIVKLLNLTKINYIKNNSLKTIICSSTFLSKSDYKIFYENFKIFICQGYGLSEATNFNCLMPIDQKKISKINSFFSNEKFLSIGNSIPGNKVYINSKKKIGEIVIEGKFLMNGYYGFKNKRVTKVKTGDLGYEKKFNNKNYIFIVGRKKEIIKYLDETVYPVDIENYILNSLKLNINFFCFGFKIKNLTHIGCFIDRKTFSRKLENNLLNLKKKSEYKYFPQYFFVGDISQFQTNTNKPKRKLISNKISKNFDKFISKTRYFRF